MMGSNRGSLWANINYFVFLLIFTALLPIFSPFEIVQKWLNNLFLPQLDLGSLKDIEAYRSALESKKYLVYLIQFLPVLFLIAFWIWKRGLLPVTNLEERPKGMYFVIIANLLLLLGIGVFYIIASGAKGGGSISGVPLGLWGMVCAFIGWIGVILIEWRRWKEPSVKLSLMQGIILITLFYKPLEYIYHMFFR